MNIPNAKGVQNNCGGNNRQSNNNKGVNIDGEGHTIYITNSDPPKD